ncbi:hypothetical protein [Hymenobacter glaciei]|uniref:hypothetical protein n=1 Tax=Hymenobacter glaciei TaxID=877209 RepID=UPI0031EB67D2
MTVTAGCPVLVMLLTSPVQPGAAQTFRAIFLLPLPWHGDATTTSPFMPGSVLRQ